MAKVKVGEAGLRAKAVEIIENDLVGDLELAVLVANEGDLSSDRLFNIMAMARDHYLSAGDLIRTFAGEVADICVQYERMDVFVDPRVTVGSIISGVKGEFVAYLNSYKHELSELSSAPSPRSSG